MSSSSAFQIRSATVEDVGLILSFIKGLADYEKLSHEVVATEELLADTLFGPHANAEVLLGFAGETPAAFALFFQNFSTFLGRPGIYLEDLFVLPEQRGKGFGKQMLSTLAKIAVERGCGRFEWSVLDWNEPAIGFYKRMGAFPMEGWTVYRTTGDALQRLASEAGD